MKSPVMGLCVYTIVTLLHIIPTPPLPVVSWKGDHWLIPQFSLLRSKTCAHLVQALQRGNCHCLAYFTHTTNCILQWNPSRTDTIGTKDFVVNNKVSLAQRLVVDHAPPTIMASYDKATMKKTVSLLIRDLSISRLLGKNLGNIATTGCW